MSSSRKQIEVQREEQMGTKKWCVALRDDVLKRFLSQQGNNSLVTKVFGDGSLFSPFLFGKFFDPSDAFPLWEFESEVLLCNLRASGLTTVDWFRTDQDYVLKADLQGIGKNTVQVYADNPKKAVEICGQWNQMSNNKNNKDWRSGNWWEFGFVRRLELPDDADLKKIEAFFINDTFLELKIPKKNCDINDDGPSYQPNDVSI